MLETLSNSINSNMIKTPSHPLNLISTMFKHKATQQIFSCLVSLSEVLPLLLHSSCSTRNSIRKDNSNLYILPCITNGPRVEESGKQSFKFSYETVKCRPESLKGSENEAIISPGNTGRWWVTLPQEDERSNLASSKLRQ